MSSSATQPSAGAFDGLVIRWDRTIVFLLGAVSLALALLTGLLAALTPVTWPWPVFLLLLGLGSLASLRYVAAGDRAVRQGRAVGGARAESAQDIALEDSQAHRPESAGRLFDNEQHVALETRAREEQDRADLDLPEDQSFLADLLFQDEAPGAAEMSESAPIAQQAAPARAEDRARRVVVERRTALTQEELRAAALRVAEESAAAPAGRTWDPVPVPRPTYTRAAVAPREAPQPLQAPVAPVASSTSLHQAAQAPVEQAPAAQSPAIDLDDVLSRRRA